MGRQVKGCMAGLALAMVCGWAAQGVAGEKVITFQSGVSDGFPGAVVLAGALPGAGSYRFDYTSSISAQFTLSAGYVDHYDVFLAPPPRPHAEYLEGDDQDHNELTDKFGTSSSIEFFVPSMYRDFYNAGPEYEYRGVPAGTPVYREQRYEDPYYWAEIVGDEFGGPFNYTITVTQTGVPEPAVWAVMILGFTGVGVAMRRRRVRAVLELA